MKQSNKVIALIMSIIMAFCSLTVSAFAVAKEKSTANLTGKEKELSISKEIISKRDEFTKVYELENGLFYEVSSLHPIHVLKNGKWEEAKQVNQPQTVKDAEKNFKKLASAVKLSMSTTQTRSSSINTNITTVFLNAYGEEYIDNSSIMLLKINGLFPQSSFEVTSSARVLLDLNVEIDDSSYMYVYKNATSMDNATYADFNTFNYVNNGTNSNNLLDKVDIIDSSLYSFDITTAYDKWSKRLSENTGLAFMTNTNDENYIAYYYEAFVERVYTKETLDFSGNMMCNTVNMDEAGYVYIDALSNTLMHKRTELAEVSHSLPVDILRFYNQDDVNNGSGGLFGDGSVINYAVQIQLDSSASTTSYKWTSLEGHTVLFPLANGTGTVTAGGYTLTKPNSDFSNAYIVAENGTRYELTGDGHIDQIKNSSGGTLAKVAYVTADGAKRIQYISDANNIRFYFNYDSRTFTVGNESFSRKLLTGIAAKVYDPITHNMPYIQINGHDAIYTYTYIPVSTEVVLLSTVTYPDLSSISYTYNSSVLNSITGIDNRRITFSYSTQVADYNVSTSGSRFTITTGTPSTVSRSPIVCGYTIESLNNQTYSTDLTVVINNKNLYHRVFEYSTGDEEIYIYDSSLRLVSRKTVDDEYYSYIYNNGSVDIVSNESIGDNTISDPGFNNITANWDGNTSGGPSGTSVEVNYLSGGYNRAMLLCANSSGAAYSEQFIDYIVPGTDITVGADFYFDSIPKKDGIVGIEVRAYDSDLDTSTVLDTMIVDSSTYLEKQTCFKTIHLDENLSDELELYIRLISYQTGSNLLVDNAFCYFNES